MDLGVSCWTRQHSSCPASLLTRLRYSRGFATHKVIRDDGGRPESDILVEAEVGDEQERASVLEARGGGSTIAGLGVQRVVCEEITAGDQSSL